MTDLFQVYTVNPRSITVTKSETYGGVVFTINEGYELTRVLDWFQTYNDQLVKESKAREQFESVAVAYQSYQTALNLVLDQV